MSEKVTPPFTGDRGSGIPLSAGEKKREERHFFHPRFWGVSAALWTSCILALALTPNVEPSWLMRKLGDKVLHGFAFGVGCLLWAKALQTNPRLPRITMALVGAVIALGIGLAVEGLQEYVPSRRADVRDILADVLGVLPALAYLTLAETVRRSTKRNII